jgi:predicted DCC family thiol-disulfide oxidoreductase YuxK
MQLINENIILFDGICNLCNSTVRFIVKRDSKAKFKFASLQSEIGQTILQRFNLPIEEFDSFVYVQGDKYFLKSSAALNVIKELRGFWKVLYAFVILPKPLRDFAYNIIAQTRYKLFGKREICTIPTPEMRQRFLDWQ